MGFPARKVHMTGIGGVGMSGVAGMLLFEDVEVSGSDLKESPVLDKLRNMGATSESARPPKTSPPAPRCS